MTLGGAVDRHWRLMFVADGATTLLSFGGLIFLFSRLRVTPDLVGAS